MENNFFFQFWVSRSLRDFHVVLSVVAICSQIIGAVSGNLPLAKSLHCLQSYIFFFMAIFIVSKNF